MTNPQPQIQDYCERCREPLGHTSFELTVTPDPPVGGVFSIRICDACKSSLGRWVKRDRGGNSASRSRLRGVHSKVLDDYERGIRRQVLIPILGVAALFVGLIAMVAFGKIKIRGMIQK